MAKYNDWINKEGLLKIEGWTRDGLTDKQIAENIGVSERTFTDWKKKFTSISSVLKRGKEVVDRHVENALFKKATGYSYDEKTYKVVTVKEKHTEVIDGKKVSIDVPVQKEILVKRTVKHVAPDTGAIAFWLKNRKPGKWRDKQEIEHSGGVSITGSADKLRNALKERRGKDG